ncbi:MAG: hypothetical protein AABX01_00045 [Candidatus Micrarchaeota archaeon]
MDKHNNSTEKEFSKSLEDLKSGEEEAKGEIERATKRKEEMITQTRMDAVKLQEEAIQDAAMEKEKLIAKGIKEIEREVASIIEKADREADKVRKTAKPKEAANKMATNFFN